MQVETIVEVNIILDQKLMLVTLAYGFAFTCFEKYPFINNIFYFIVFPCKLTGRGRVTYTIKCLVQAAS